MLEFLNLKTDAFGLDMNSSAARIIKLKKRGGFFEVASHNSLPIAQGLISGGEIKDEDSLAKLIKEARGSAKGERLGAKHVVASLPEEKSFVQIIKIPKMKESELNMAVPFEVENHLPLPIDSVYMDFEVLGPASDNPSLLDVFVAAAPKRTVDSYVSCFEKAGLIPYAFEPESESITRALIKDRLSKSPFVLINIGENGACFAVFWGKSVRFTSSIPMPVSGLKSGARPGLEEFSAYVEKYMAFCRDRILDVGGSAGGGFQKIIISGLTADSAGLTEFLSEKFKIPAEPGNPFANIPVKNKNYDFSKNFPAFVPAIGLALREFL